MTVSFVDWLENMLFSGFCYTLVDALNGADLLAEDDKAAEEYIREIDQALHDRQMDEAWGLF